MQKREICVSSRYFDSAASDKYRYSRMVYWISKLPHWLLRSVNQLRYTHSNIHFKMLFCINCFLNKNLIISKRVKLIFTREWKTWNEIGCNVVTFGSLYLLINNYLFYRKLTWIRFWMRHQSPLALWISISFI